MKPFQNRPSTAVMHLERKKGPADNVGGTLTTLVLYGKLAVLASRDGLGAAVQALCGGASEGGCSRFLRAWTRSTM